MPCPVTANAFPWPFLTATEVAFSIPPCSQVWDSVTGKLKKDLSYQAEEMFMMHEQAVLCLGFSRDSEMLVSGGCGLAVRVCISLLAQVFVMHGQCLSLSREFRE